MTNPFSRLMYALGAFNLGMAPFTGVTVLTTAAFFAIAWITDDR